MSAPIDLASNIILAPAGLSENDIERVLHELMSHAIDSADLYFQTSRHESWGLDDGIVKSGSHSFERGGGVRAVSGEKTGFAYSDEIVLPALTQAAGAARAAARAGQEGRVQAWARGGKQALYKAIDPIETLSSADKIALLHAVDAEARRIDPRITQVMVSLAAVHDVVLVAASDGTLAAAVRPLVRMNVSVVADDGDRREQGSSAFSVRIGERVASPLCTVVDDGTLASRRGSLNIDDEGTPTQCTMLIEKGVLKGYLQDKMNARLMGVAPTGNGRRESYAHLPMPRMTNTYMLPGESNPAEIIASVEKGLYAVNFGGGQVDITSGKFVFSASEAYMIENGKITYPVKGATLIGNGPDVLTRVSMVGNDLQLDAGVGTCGKEGQGVPVGVGQPTVRIDGLTVGGTGA